jgi:hypothetical protein
VRTVEAGDSLAAGLAMTDLGIGDFWIRYFGLGGAHPRDGLQAYLDGEIRWSPHEHDVAAHALNEYFAERQMDHPVRYAEDF